MLHEVRYFYKSLKAMNIEIFLKSYAAKIIGFSIVVCNLIFLTKAIILLYEYHFTTTLFLYMYPNTVLSIFSILFFIGIYIGILIIKRKVSYVKWSLIDLGLVTLAFIIDGSYTTCN